MKSQKTRTSGRAEAGGGDGGGGVFAEFAEKPASRGEGRRQRSDGEQSRQAILMAAAKLATTRGLHGLSLGQLAEHIGMSKSGLFAHFGSKDELELATIEKAAEIFDHEVVAAARAAGPGLAQLDAIVDGFLSHLGRKVFPGGCFFTAVAAEIDAHPGKARQRILELLNAWREMITVCLREAQERGEIRKKVEIEQLVFEVLAMLAMANRAFAMSGEEDSLRRGREGVRRVVEGARGG